jgi:hypothetical protein
VNTHAHVFGSQVVVVRLILIDQKCIRVQVAESTAAEFSEHRESLDLS